jgi:hypothetical protein
LASAILKRDFEAFINGESFAVALCYQNETTKQLALNFCQMAKQQLNLSFDFETSGWDLNLVTDAQSIPNGGHALVDADMIVFATNGNSLSQQQQEWVEKWLPERKNSGLLVFLHHQAPDAPEDSFLAPLAHRAKLDLLQLPASAVTSIEPKAPPEPAIPPALAEDPAALNRFRPIHWGINE